MEKKAKECKGHRAWRAPGGHRRTPSVGGGSDVLIGNLHVNPEGPLPQLVLDQSIKMLAANGWVAEGLSITETRGKSLLTPCILHEVRRERTLPAFRVCVLASAHGALALPLPCR